MHGRRCASREPSLAGRGQGAGSRGPGSRWRRPKRQRGRAAAWLRVRVPVTASARGRVRRAGGRQRPLVPATGPEQAAPADATSRATARPRIDRERQIDYATGCHSDKYGNQAGKRSTSDRNNEKDLEAKAKKSASEQFYEQTISYNISETERPGGLKVRFKITVVTGKKAAALDARQAEAIRRLLEWTLQHRQETPSR